MPAKKKVAKVAKAVGDHKFDVVKFEEIQHQTHSQQAVWFLNGFWADGMEEQAETVWDFVHRFLELQYGKPKYYGAIGKKQKQDVVAPEGSSLDQFQAQQFLEKLGEVKTASQLRKDLATIDINNDNRMSLTEFLMFKYGHTPHQVVNAPQGGNAAEMAAAEAQMTECRAELDDLTEKFEAAEEAKALAATEAAAAAEANEKASAAAAEAKSALEVQEAADAEVQAARAEVQAAVDALEAAQEAQRKQLASLEAKANDPNLGVVKRNKAKNQIEQMKSEDPLPISKAKITQGAALKKAEKAAKAAAKATANCASKSAAANEAADEAAQASAQADEAAAASEAAAAEVEAAVVSTQAKLAKLEETFAALKNSGGGVAHGKLWWMEREMKEVKKFAKGGRR
jgi:hypothetical protein